MLEERAPKGIGMASKAKRSSKKRKHEIVVHCNSSGARADGKGSGFAWTRLDTHETHVEFVDGLTNNGAELRGILSALRSMPRRANVCVSTASAVTASQVNGTFKVTNPKLADLHAEISSVTRKRRLNVSAEWVPKAENLADKILKQARADLKKAASNTKQ